jgi:hypothetical protein
MPELHHILGSLFRDVAQSVFTSDMYSRELSQYYEQDALLRHFPVPRTEIEELEVQLKFAIAGIEVNPAHSVGRESSAAAIFIDFSYDLTENFFETLLERLQDQEGVAPGTWRTVRSLEQHIYLRQDLLRYFQRKQGNLIQEGEFQVKSAGSYVDGLLSRRAKKLVEASDFSDGDLKKLVSGVMKSLNVEAELNELSEPLKFAWQQGGDFTLNVEVSADRLQDLETDQLSTINVRTRLRNYIWEEVEHEGRRWWTLNPE